MQLFHECLSPWGVLITFNIRAKAMIQKILNKNKASGKMNRCRGGLMKKVGSR
jgi:hypothetical protein